MLHASGALHFCFLQPSSSSNFIARIKIFLIEVSYFKRIYANENTVFSCLTKSFSDLSANLINRAIHRYVSKQ